MSDPAIEAARRACTQHWPEQGDFEFEFNMSGSHRDWAVDAAREALKPIRNLIDEWERTGHLDYDQLRASVYSSEELS